MASTVGGVLETGERVVGERVEARIVSGVGNHITGAENVLKRTMCVRGVGVLDTSNRLATVN